METYFELKEQSDAAGTQYYLVGKFVAKANEARVRCLLSMSRPTLDELNQDHQTLLEAPPSETRTSPTARTALTPPGNPSTPSSSIDTVTPRRRQSCRAIEEPDELLSTPRRSARLALKKAQESMDCPTPLLSRARRKLQL